MVVVVIAVVAPALMKNLLELFKVGENSKGLQLQVVIAYDGPTKVLLEL